MTIHLRHDSRLGRDKSINKGHVDSSKVPFLLHNQPCEAAPPSPTHYRGWCAPRIVQVVAAVLFAAALAGGYYYNHAYHGGQALRRSKLVLQPLMSATVGTELPDVTPMVLHTSVDDCAGALEISKVALLFIAQHGMLHEPIWRHWFAAVAGLVPVEALQSTRVCTQGGFQADLVRHMCGSGTGPLLQQHLFNVYVHTPGGRDGLLKGTVFEGTEIPNRLPAPPDDQHLVWHGAPFVRILKMLLSEAFKDPANSYFVLLSDSTIPLYPAATVYRQLLADTSARINACDLEGKSEERFSKLMLKPWFQQRHWRKSRPWFGLKRAHAAAVVADRKLEQLFAAACPKLLATKDDASEKMCRFEEHYVPSLLAMRGLDGTTDCHGELVYVETHPGTNLPHVFYAEDVSQGLVEQLRGDEHGCNPVGATDKAGKSFLDALAPTLENVCQHASVKRYNVSMPAHCSMFARKFDPGATDKLLEVLGNCGGGWGDPNVLCRAR